MRGTLIVPAIFILDKIERTSHGVHEGFLLSTLVLELWDQVRGVWIAGRHQLYLSAGFRLVSRFTCESNMGGIVGDGCGKLV